VFTTYNQDFDLGKFRAELVIEYWHFMGDYSCYTSVLLLLYKAVLQTERHKKCFDVVQTLGLSILEIDDTSREIHPLQMHAARFLPPSRNALYDRLVHGTTYANAFSRLSSIAGCAADRTE
jgi:hypothetical protein